MKTGSFPLKYIGDMCVLMEAKINANFAPTFLFQNQGLVSRSP